MKELPEVFNVPFKRTIGDKEYTFRALTYLDLANLQQELRDKITSQAAKDLASTEDEAVRVMIYREGRREAREIDLFSEVDKGDLSIIAMILSYVLRKVDPSTTEDQVDELITTLMKCPDTLNELMQDVFGLFLDDKDKGKARQKKKVTSS